MALDLAHRHAARIEAENFLVKAVEPGLALGDQQRLEAAGPVARNGNLDLAIVGQDGLGAGAVAAVATATAGRVALLVAEMFAQLGSQRAFDQRLLQLFEKPIRASQVPGFS
jgi:hypothetical protein